tara:strand:- start:1285 stop:2139 length:855 start_codon:yes stop_codon:yes gene_type:complete
MRFIFLSLLLIFNVYFLYAQDDLLSQIDQDLDPESVEVSSTFKGTRLINGHSVETRSKKNLTFIISHRFGNIRGGAYEFFGMDGANIRLGLDYAITDKFTVGIGRNSLGKHLDGFAKYRILRQSGGEKQIPVSLTYFGSAAYRTVRTEPERTFQQNLAFTHQLLIARKISSAISLQLMPVWVHYNAVSVLENNDVFAVGVGGRYKIGKRFSVNIEYYHQIQELNPDYFNALALGFDIDTGGHIFQFHITNSAAMIAKGFVGETTDDFFGGNIHLGFNITRNFQL